MKNIIHKQISQYAQEKKVLDVGCGNKYYSDVSTNTITVDGWDKVSPDVLIDLEVIDLPFKENEFECVLMIDFIEHLEKERGEDIIKQAKLITSGRIYLLTPLWWQDNLENVNNPNLWCYGNQMDIHKSLWTKEEFLNDKWVSIGYGTPPKEYFFGYWEKT